MPDAERPDGVDPAGAPGRSSRSPSGVPQRLVLANVPSLDALCGAGFQGARARDFEDFVAGDRSRAMPVLPLPDPSFRERLRRHLWRIQILTRRDRGLVRH